MAEGPGNHRVPYETGLYTPAVTERVYRRLTREAEKSIREGSGAILDATFIERSKREKIVRTAAKTNTPLFVIECRAADETTEKRLAQRAAEGKDLSDGRWEIYIKQKAAYEPMEEFPEANRLVLDTARPVDLLAMNCEKFLRAGLAGGQP
jgi:predicted kinase